VHLSGGGICHSSPSSPSSRGRFSIDLFDPTATPAKISIPLSSPRTAGKLKPSVQTTLSSNVESITSETSTISAAEEREDGPHGPAATSSSQTNKIHQRGQSSSVRGDDDNLHKDNGNFQMSLSVDPLSSARLVRQLLTVVLTSTSAFVGTLKLIAPMIVARRCLNIILFVFYDHYNGRYIRTTYTKRMQHLQRFEVLAALRSAGRIALQSLALGIAGGIISSLMDVAPCFIQPLWMCSAWHACVWVATVYVLEWFTQTWLIVQVRHPLIKIRQTQTVSTLTHHQRRRSRNRNKSNRGLRWDKSMMPGPTPTTTLRSTLTEIPQLILHRLEDPEEWVDSMLRPILGGGQYARYYTSTNDDNPRSMRYGRRTTKLDTLLFPSTWTPLRLLLSLAVGFAIFNTYESHGSGIGGPKSRTLRRLVMRSFVFQEVIHSEWLRVFVHERRIALGAVFSIVDLVAYIAVMIPIVAVSGPIGALLLFPPLIARLVSGWMNFLLYHDRYFGGPVPGFTIRHWPFVRNDS
jgi:tryptophan-rich sensory protein